MGVEHFVQDWALPFVGLLLSAGGILFSWRAWIEAKSARVAATDARKAAIRAHQVLTIHRDLLPQVQQLDGLLKILMEELTTATVEANNANEVIDRLSKVGHAANSLERKQVGDLLERARDHLTASSLTREAVLEARNLVNSAAARLRYDSNSVSVLAGGD